MPKDRRISSLSSDRSRLSPYACSSRNAKQFMTENLSETFNDAKEWEDARCPICMEHPHNAVLLQCSSYKKGCRPYMCNTSHRHSNCLDQYSKSSASSPSKVTFPSISVTTASDIRSGALPSDEQGGIGGCCLPKDLVCPLCRGEIYGWDVIEAARKFMNSKSRSCSSEKCDFSGTYSELRKHARAIHPLVRPTEVDPARQRDWSRLEQERDFEDMLSSIHSVFGVDSSEIDLPFDSLLLFLRLYYMFANLDVPVRRERGQRQRSSRMRFRYNVESDHGVRADNSSTLEIMFRGRDRSSLQEAGQTQWRPWNPSSERWQSQWRHQRSSLERGNLQSRQQSSSYDRVQPQGRHQSSSSGRGQPQGRQQSWLPERGQPQGRYQNSMSDRGQQRGLRWRGSR